MATVYRAHDSRLDTFRAIKILLPEYARHQKLRHRFEKEAQTMAKLHHTNILTVHDVSSDQNKLFIVMELITGGCLMDRIEEEGPLPASLAVRTIARVLLGLEYAHARGVIHRDIKPHNIMITSDGIPKLADFGIAQVRNTDADLTQTGSIMGTWAYMAPEQRASARQVDVRSDVYAMTATLFALVTGEEPFDLFAPDAHAEHFDVMNPALAAVIRKGSAYLQDARYESAASLRQALLEIVDQLPSDPVDAMTLASPAQVERFETGSLSGFEGNLEIADRSGTGSTPTFDTDSLSNRATANFERSHLGPNASGSPDTSPQANVEINRVLPASANATGISRTVIALGIVGFVLTLVAGLFAISMVLDTDVQAVAELKTANTNRAEQAATTPQEAMSAPLNRSVGTGEDDANNDFAEIKNESASMQNQAQEPAAQGTKSGADTPAKPMASPKPDTPRSASPASEPAPFTNQAPKGKIRVSCRPSCDIAIKSQVQRDEPAIKRRNAFKGDVYWGPNLVLMRHDGKMHKHVITVYESGSDPYCYDFSTGSVCSD